jgi:hypothetical protein
LVVPRYPNLTIIPVTAAVDLDALVYKLYGLTEEEIRIVEGQ